MTSPEDLFDAINCVIRFTTPEGEYEGVLTRVFIPSRMITVAKILLLPSKIKLGTLNFMCQEVSNVKILTRPDTPCENENETSLLYFRPDIEGVFILDQDSETESNIDELSNEEEFVMKLLPCFSKWISSDSQIIDSLNNEFTLAIKLISKEDLIGVSLEGPKTSRNGILTWLCISTTSCTYLFDVLALGEKSFQNGLKSILENSKIKKIFHDCRLVSDCLFHMFNVCLVNVFDTQVADTLVLMQENENCSIIKKVNSLDTCLSYYLELPDDYLYAPLTFSLDKKSTHYHGLRPLRPSFRGAMIKNVIYLKLLKRELETALMTPLRRATDVYLNVIQNATDRELMVAAPVLDELPPELLLEGIQVVRYQQYEYIPPIVHSGPPYRKLVNPLKDFVDCCRKFQTKEEIKFLPSEDDSISRNMEAKECSFTNVSDEACANSSQFMRDFSKPKHISGSRNTNSEFNLNEYHNIKNSASFPQSHEGDSVCTERNLMNEMSPDVSLTKKSVLHEMASGFGDVSIEIKRSNEDEKNCVKTCIDPFKELNKDQGKTHVAGNTCITDNIASSNVRRLEKETNEVEINSHFSENKCKVSNPIGNCLLRPFNEMPFEKDFESTKSSMITSESLDGNSKMLLGQNKMLNIQPVDSDDLWDKIRKECVTQQSNDDFNGHRPKIRFVPAGMATF